MYWTGPVDLGRSFYYGSVSVRLHGKMHIKSVNALNIITMQAIS
jgi:hypothetical protein